MSPKDLLLALVVVVVWGVNFVVFKGRPARHTADAARCVALYARLRTAVFFVRRPRMPWFWLVAYGATISLGQFAFLFSAMYVGMPAGLASLVLQAQAVLHAVVRGDVPA